MSADGLTGSRLVVPDLSGRPAMEVENEEFLIPNSLSDISSSPKEGTVRRGRRLLGVLRPLLSVCRVCVLINRGCKVTSDAQRRERTSSEVITLGLVEAKGFARPLASAIHAVNSYGCTGQPS